MKDIYTTQEAALDVIESRRQDPDTRDRVAEYLGNVLPASCFEQQQPIAILARYVPRATREDLFFAEQASEAGLVPYWASYVADRFTTRNPEKVETIRPPIRWQKGQKTRSWIVEPEKRQGGVGALETVYGYTSANFQQGIREIVMRREGVAELADNTFDMGDWYKIQAPRFGYTGGNLAPYYYPATMALATTFGVLYEDFDGGPNASSGDLAAFMSQVVYPSIDKVERELGLTPVIVRLPYQERMNETDLSFLDAAESEQFKNFGSVALLSDKVE